MNSLPIPNSPTRSNKTGPRAFASARGLTTAAVTLVALALLPGVVRAHGETDDEIPSEPGWRIAASAALSVLDAGQALPSQQLAGFLLQGDAGMDRRNGQLEHGTLSAGWRLTPAFGAHVAVGKHGTDPHHTEAAWVQWQDGERWSLGAGRRRPSLGPVIGGAGHFDRFGLLPLAKQAAFGHDWIDDGLEATWRTGAADAEVRLDAGAWRGRTWPGGGDGPATLAVHAGAVRGDWTLDAFWAHLRPEGRGTRTSGAGAGHSHSAPVCDAALTQVACFTGQAQVAGASARWLSHDWPLEVTGALLWHRDRGSLASRNGLATYRGDTVGSWVDLVWTPQAAWEAGLRLERLTSRQRLEGAGASLLATETGLTAYGPARRATLMFGWLPRAGVALRLEAGQEALAGRRVRFAGLRAVFALARTASSRH